MEQLFVGSGVEEVEAIDPKPLLTTQIDAGSPPQPTVTALLRSVEAGAEHANDDCLHGLYFSIISYPQVEQRTLFPSIHRHLRHLLIEHSYSFGVSESGPTSFALPRAPCRRSRNGLRLVGLGAGCGTMPEGCGGFGHRLDPPRSTSLGFRRR